MIHIPVGLGCVYEHETEGWSAQIISLSLHRYHLDMLRFFACTNSWRGVIIAMFLRRSPFETVHCTAADILWGFGDEPLFCGSRVTCSCMQHAIDCNGRSLSHKQMVAGRPSKPFPLISSFLQSTSVQMSSLTTHYPSTTRHEQGSLEKHQTGKHIGHFGRMSRDLVFQRTPTWPRLPQEHYHAIQ